MLSALFDISVPTVKEVIHSCSSVYREKYRQHVRWPSLEERTNFQGRWQKLPFDIEGIDGISTEIYRSGIEPQEHYYSGNTHYHCIHTQVVITNDGEFESRSGRGVQHCVMEFSDLRQVGGFRQVLRFPPPIKSTGHDITEMLIKVALNTIKQTNNKRRHYLLRRK